MTHLPLEDRNVWGVPGPDYTPKRICAHPFCHHDGGPWSQLEKHHLWPRSFLRHQPQNWVKLPDGTRIGNLVYLCREHHQQITENRSAIYFTGGRFIWDDPDWADVGDTSINPQPPRAVDDWPEEGVKEIADDATDEPPLGGGLANMSRREGVQSVDDDASEWLTSGEIPLDSGDPQVGGIRPGPGTGHTHEEVPEGTECPTCNRRVPKKRKATTPTSKVHSFRGPLDQADVLEETFEAAAKNLGVYGNTWWKHETVFRSLVLALQEPGQEE